MWGCGVGLLFWVLGEGWEVEKEDGGLYLGLPWGEVFVNSVVLAVCCLVSCLLWFGVCRGGVCVSGGMWGVSCGFVLMMGVLGLCEW